MAAPKVIVCRPDLVNVSVIVLVHFYPNYYAFRIVL